MFNKEYPDAGPCNSDKRPSPESPDPIDQLTHAVECAITMMSDDEQAFLVSHIMIYLHVAVLTLVKASSPSSTGLCVHPLMANRGCS